MAWLKKDSRLRGHPKLIACAGALGVKSVYLQGHLDSLWLACLERYEDGDLSGLSNEKIAILAEWNTTNADRFVELLKEHGWFDGCLIHDWLDYVGDYLKRKYRKSPEKLLAIYEKHGREQEIQKKDTSGTRTGHVPDTSGTTQEVDKDKETDQETTHTHTPPEISKKLRTVAELISLTPDQPLKSFLLLYPEDWIENAIHRAVVSGKRDWHYVRAILVKFQKNGGPPDDDHNTGTSSLKPNAPTARRSPGAADFSDVENGQPL